MKLVKNGANVNYRNFKYSICKKLTGKVTSYPDKNTSGNTPLMKAAKKGYLNIVKFLVENNADVNYEDQDGNTSLMLAAENGRIEIFNILLLYKVHVYHKNQGGFTALTCSIKNKNLIIKTFKEFLKFKNEINSPNSSNQPTTNIKKQSLLMI